MKMLDSMKYKILQQKKRKFIIEKTVYFEHEKFSDFS